MISDLAWRISDIESKSVSVGSIYLTFDDGPDPVRTPMLLDILAGYNISATFFLLGKHAILYPNIVKRIQNEGHLIGNHTWNHYHPWLIKSRIARREVVSTTHLLEDITGDAIKVFRPPYGIIRRDMLDVTRELGQTFFLWDLSGIDWGWFAQPRLILQRLRRALPDDVILLHDAVNNYNKPDVMMSVLPIFIREKIQLGCRFENSMQLLLTAKS